MQQQVHHVYDLDELKQRLIDVWHRFDQSFIDDTLAQSSMYVNLSERRTF